MAAQGETFIVADGAQWRDLGGGMRRRILGYDGRLMMVCVDFEAGAVGAAHDHHHSQATYVAGGRFEVTVGGSTRILTTGDGFYAAPGQVHGVRCIEPGALIDVFSPCREDFIALEIG